MQKIVSIVIALGLGIGVGYVLNRFMSTSSSEANLNRSSTNRSTPSDGVVRGPYPTDADGCIVIDLRAVSAAEHNRATKTYVWLVEHPTAAACLRQTNPTIPEWILESTNEKIQGTNIWRLTFRYE